MRGLGGVWLFRKNYLEAKGRVVHLIEKGVAGEGDFEGCVPRSPKDELLTRFFVRHGLFAAKLDPNFGNARLYRSIPGSFQC